ncbi:MAG: Holliday junction branch migration protein RuvA [Elusimicrobia bacterium]|nr:Holliday junction branch migration protein RuvA [Elusimicrobiota bacterium]
MIVSLRGPLLERTEEGCVVEAGGVGYGVALSTSSALRLPPVGEEIRLLIVESVAMYGGATALYGFLTDQEKQVFLVLKENVPGTGAKKALELLDKAAKSFAEFRRAVMEKDVKTLVAMFAFTSKTAEKLVAALQGKMDALSVSGGSAAMESSSAFEESVAGLVSLGYRESSARQAAQSARDVLGGRPTSQDILRESLKHLAGRG